MAEPIICPLCEADVAEVLLFWRRIEGMGLDDIDAPSSLARYLARNPGFSFVARDDAGQVIGAALAGHDGRRGYVHHLAVAMPHRRLGLGGRLLEHCLSALRAAGLAKCHLFVFADNDQARSLYEASGWTRRDDLAIYSHSL